MKDNLFEMLLNLFETSLAQIQKGQNSTELSSENEGEELFSKGNECIHIKSAQHTSFRVLTYPEQMKLTKASYQFLMRMQLWDILNREIFEIIMSQLLFSESRIVTLQETKWTIRNTLATELDNKQLAFLDLVLYRVEDKLTAQ